jgi:hypothetical protein
MALLRSNPGLLEGLSTDEVGKYVLCRGVVTTPLRVEHHPGMGVGKYVLCRGVVTTP